MRRSFAISVLALAACNPGAFDDFIAPPRTETDDAGRGPDPRDAAVGSLDAGPLVDASVRADAGALADSSLPALDDAGSQDAAIDSGAPPLERDPCGQYRPMTPAQSGIEAGGTVFAGKIEQNTKVSPRWPTDVVLADNQLWWLFGPAFRPGSLFIESTDSATRSSVQLPYALAEAAADAALPTPFLPALDADRAQLQVGEQLEHNTGSVITTGPNDGLIFYAASGLSGSEQGLVLRTLGTRVADVHFEAGRATATPRAALFGPDRPTFRYGLLAGGFVYLYGCQPGGFFTFNCMVARAPLEQATVGASYQFRTTGGWSSDFSAATYVLDSARDDLSISFNPFLNSYLAVHLHGIDSQLDLRTSRQPDGPWEPFATITLPKPEGGQISHYGGMEHPELASLCGRKLVLTYLFGNAGDASELRRVEVLLREGPH